MKITTAEKCPKCKETGRTTRLITENADVYCKLGHKFTELPSEAEARAAESANLPAENAPAAAPVDLDRLNAEGGAKLLDVATHAPTLAPPPSDDRRAPGLVNTIARTAIDQVDRAVVSAAVVDKKVDEQVAELGLLPVQDTHSGHVILQIRIPQDRADELKAYGEQCSPPQTLQERVQSVVEFGLENGWFA